MKTRCWGFFFLLLIVSTFLVFDPTVLKDVSVVDNNVILDKAFQSQNFKFTDTKDFIWDSLTKTGIEAVRNSNYAAFQAKSQKNQDWSLISIIGASGVGKTRLSFEIARMVFGHRFLEMSSNSSLS